MADYNFKIVIEKDEDGLFVASVPALSGCHTQGKTYEEAMKRIEEAIKLNLEVQQARTHGRLEETFLHQPKFLGIEDLIIRYA